MFRPDWFTRRPDRERAIELTLSHDGQCWYANGAGLRFTAESLGTLERRICARLLVPRNAVADLKFDMSSLPAWLHQYQAHYFNYRLRPAPPVTGL